MLKTLHKFHTVPKMIKFFNDHSEEEGTFKELGEPPKSSYKGALEYLLSQCNEEYLRAQRGVNIMTGLKRGLRELCKNDRQN